MGNQTNIPRSISSYVAEYCWSIRIDTLIYNDKCSTKKENRVLGDSIFPTMISWFTKFHSVSHQKWNSFVPSLQWAESFISLIKKWHSFVPFNPFDWVLVLRVLGACVSLLHTSWWRSFHLPEKKGARRLEGGDTVWPAPRRNHQNSGYCMILLGCEFEFPWKRHKLPSGKLT